MSESINTTRTFDHDKLDYSICAQFLFMHLACLLVLFAGVSWVSVVTCLALYVVRMFAITAGFHRLLAHRTYRTSRVFQFLIAFTGTASYQKGPLWWSAHHRLHHLVADTSEDFHSPLTRRFWRAHFGWFLSEDSQETHWKLIANLSKYPELRFLDRYYSLPPIVLAASAFGFGSLLARYAPSLGTSGFQMLVWAFFISTVVLYHGTFTLNSLAHIFGKRRFETNDNSRNNVLVAIITSGEGWHNNHHAEPNSASNQRHWWEIDLTYLLLRLLVLLGLAWDVQLPKQPPVQASVVPRLSG